MSETLSSVLESIRTLDDMVLAFQSEDKCRQLVESIVWPKGRICPACGYKHSISLAGRDSGRGRSRPGLYQCSNSYCRFQFTVTTRTPLHATKLPLQIWLKAMWLILQSDKGLSSVRLAEALGVSQPTAWRMGHAIRLLTAQEHLLDGTVETDHFYLGGSPPKKRNVPPPGRGRKGKKKTTKTPILSMVQRPQSTEVGSPAGHARASVVADLSAYEASCVFGQELDPQVNLLSDDWTAFAALGHNFSDHQTVNHSNDEYVRGAVHINSSEGFSSRVRRTVSGVFHHISTAHANLYMHEIGFRWSQRVVKGQAVRQTRNGKKKLRTIWSRVPPALQIAKLLRNAVGRQMRQTQQSGISVRSEIAVFG